MFFTHLHTHSYYSLLDGLSSVDELLDKCQELGMNSLAITDHGNMYGIIEFYKAAKKRGIKPIIGCEMYLAPDGMHLKKTKQDAANRHLILIAKNNTGYTNLIKMVTKSNLEGFYYKPRIDRQLLREHSEGLIGLSACAGGEIPQAIIGGKKQKTEKLILEYKDIFAPDCFYLELQDHQNSKDQAIINERLIELSREHNVPLVATNDIHYANLEDKNVQDVLICIQTNRKVDESNRMTMTDFDLEMRSPQQMQKSFAHIPEAIANTQKIADMCNVEIELGNTKLPDFKVPEGFTDVTFLHKLCEEGLVYRYGNNITTEIKDRLKYELSVIDKTGFASYFLIVNDFVIWAKNNGIVVGPGRGSAAGSIVSYLLRITDIDPLTYNLLFERFLNPARINMPDIDMDFADAERDAVLQYVSEKYGRDHVAQIISFGTMAARAAVRDTGRALGYEYSLCNEISQKIPMFCTLDKALEVSAELKEIYEKNEKAKKLIDFAKKLEGVKRHASTHACGVVITKDPLYLYTPCQMSTHSDENITTQYEMHAIEDLGLLKMDFLGLSNLTTLEKAIGLIEQATNKKIILDKIPLDDEKTYTQTFKKGKTTGVFQMESAGMRRYLKQLKPTNIEDVIAMVALYRPGPMDLIPDFIDRKQGRKEIEYIHPKLEPILKNTYGIAVYQEQLMQMARDLAGFSLAEADILRKAIGKKIKSLLEEQKVKLIDGMIANKIDKNIAKQIWKIIEPFASYGFNRSHAACYALIGYWTAYFKTHYPSEFMCSLLISDQGNLDRATIEIDECKSMDIEILAPDINKSFEDFTIENKNNKKAIRFGFNAIKNVGENIAKEIVKERNENGEFSSIEDLVVRVSSKGMNKKSLDNLAKAGALDNFAERNKIINNISQILNYAKEIQTNKENGQNSLFSLSPSAPDQPTFSLTLADTEPATKKERLSWEKELLGFYISEHPLEDYKKYLEKYTTSCKNLNEKNVGMDVRIGGIINRVKKIPTKRKKTMVFAELEDLTSKIEIVVFPKTLLETLDLWEQDNIILVSGKVDNRDGTLKILCEGASKILPQVALASPTAN